MMMGRRALTPADLFNAATVVFASLLLAAPLAVAGGARPEEDGATAGPALAHGDHTAKLNGLKLWYRVSGNGPVCVMPTPGWGPSSDLYFRTLKPLEELFTVVYLDTRGSGRSERPPSATDYTWDHLVADLEALRTHLKRDKVWMMGHSEGGMQVLHYACRHPQRVEGLLLLATAAAVPPGDQLRIMSRLAQRKNEPWVAEAWKLLLAGPPKTDEDFAAGMKKILPVYWADPARIAPHEAHFAATSMSVNAQRGATASKRLPFDLTGQLRKVTAPALIVAADKDIFCPPAAARQMHLSLPNSKLLLIEDCGHFMWLEQADEFNAQVPRFLKALWLERQE